MTGNLTVVHGAIVLLDTASSSNQDDLVGVRSPDAAGEAGSPAPDAGVLREPVGELLADLSCVRTLIDRYGQASEAFRIVPIDLVTMLSNGSVASLSESIALALGPVLGNGQTAAEAVEQVRALVPHIGIYVVAPQTTELARTLPALAAAGVDEAFAFDSGADVDAFEDTLRARLCAPPPETEMRLLWKWFRESPERSLVMHCVRNGYRLDVWEVRCRVFNASRKTLQNRLTFLGLPSPGIVSRCGRVLHAQELERRGVQPSSRVAKLLGFPSRVAMQRARRRLRATLLGRRRQALVFASLLK